MSAERTVGVTGATGRLGRAWIEHVLSRDATCRVLALLRPSVAADPMRWLRVLRPEHRERIEVVAADFSDLWFSQRSLDRLAAVDAGWWHFAAVTNLAATPEAEKLAAAVNAEGTLRLLAAVRATAPRVPFFHVSTAFVAGRRTGRIMETPPDMRGAFHNPYERSKARAEMHVLQFFDSGGRGAIFRPSLVVAADGDGAGGQIPDRCAGAIVAALRRGEAEFHLRLSPEARLHVVSLQFVMRALATIAARSDFSARIFHLTPAREVRFAELRSAIESTVPLTVKFSPDASRGDLPDSSRVFDWMLDEVRGYLMADVVFDRTNTEAILPSEIATETCSLPELVAQRLANETSSRARMGVEVSVSAPFD